MLRLILVTMLVAITAAQRELPRIAPTCSSVEPPIDTNGLNYVESTKSAAPTLTDAMAQRLFTGSSSERGKRAARTSTELARTELKDATGSIILSQPRFTVNLTTEPRCLCPHRNELLTSFKYNGGYCHVLFPEFQRKYYTRCLYRNCLTGCVSTTNGRRNLCRPKKSYSTVSVWSICLTPIFHIKKITLRVPTGGCECKSYPPICQFLSPFTVRV